MHNSKFVIEQTYLLNSAGPKTKQKDTKALMGRRVFAKVGSLEGVEESSLSMTGARNWQRIGLTLKIKPFIFHIVV